MNRQTSTDPLPRSHTDPRLDLQKRDHSQGRKRPPASAQDVDSGMTQSERYAADLRIRQLRLIACIMESLSETRIWTELDAGLMDQDGSSWCGQQVAFFQLTRPPNLGLAARATTCVPCRRSRARPRDVPTSDQWEDALEYPPYVPARLPVVPTNDEQVGLLVALGSVVQQSSGLELCLRMLYCALTGSKYATLTAAGASAGWLIEMCRALAGHRSDVDQEQLQEVDKLLLRADAAMKQRNRYVHDVWSSGAPHDPMTMQLMRSKRRDHQLHAAPVTTDDLCTTVADLINCNVDLRLWAHRVLGSDANIEVQLRWEEANLESTE